MSFLLDDAQHKAFYETLAPSDQATIDSECRRGAAGFLTAIPSKTLGLALEPAEFLGEVRTRLLMEVYSRTDFCPCCDCVSDSKGHHARLRAGAAVESSVTTPRVTALVS